MKSRKVILVVLSIMIVGTVALIMFTRNTGNPEGKARQIRLDAMKNEQGIFEYKDAPWRLSPDDIRELYDVTFSNQLDHTDNLAQLGRPDYPLTVIEYHADIAFEYSGHPTKKVIFEFHGDELFEIRFSFAKMDSGYEELYSKMAAALLNLYGDATEVIDQTGVSPFGEVTTKAYRWDAEQTELKTSLQLLWTCIENREPSLVLYLGILY